MKYIIIKLSKLIRNHTVTRTSKMHEITKNSEKLFLQFIAERYEGSFT